jgi:hypothetical protein
MSLFLIKSNVQSQVVLPARIREQIVAAQRTNGVWQPVTKSVLERVQADTGKQLTWDAMCNSRHVNGKCKLNRAFLRTNAAGLHVWLHVPPSYLDAYLQHYRRCKQFAPATTSACVLVPAHPGKWRKHLHGMTLLQEIPVNTPCYAGSSMTHTQYPVQIWYDAPGTDRSAPSLSAAQQTATLTMHLHGQVGKYPARILIDSGATNSFVNLRFVQQHKLRLSTSAMPPVEMANGAPEAPAGTLHQTITLQPGARAHCALTAIPLSDAFDVILGDDWCRAHKATLDYGNNSIRVVLNNRRVTLLTQPLHQPSTGVQVLSAMRFARCYNPYEDQLFVATIRAIDPSEEGPNGAQTPKPIPEPAQILMQQYPSVFAPVTTLPPEREIQHRIPLIEGSQPPYKPPYRQSPREREAMYETITELLEKRFIEPSTSPFGAPIIFVKKPRSDKLRMCVDYRALNKLTIKNRYPLPRIDDLLDKIQGASTFTALDLSGAYHQCLVAPEDQHKTAFTCPMGHFEFKVMPFGLTSAPATFQSLINKIFAKQLNKTVLAYLDDLLIISKSPEQHAKDLEEVLQILQQHKLHVSPEKSQWFKSELLYLGHVISKDGIKVDPAKTKAIEQWPAPNNLPQLRSFLGMANFFRKFVKNYSIIAKPLTDLTRSNAPWLWSPLCEEAFAKLKHALTHAPVLATPDYSEGAQPFSVVCDASITGVGAVLMQGDRPIAYESRKLTPAEINYTTTEQEMLAVIHALQTWRCYLEGIPFRIVTDHCPNTYFSTQPTLSRRQARWSEYLQQYNFEWVYKPGPQNVVADALSRQPHLATLLATSQQPFAARPPLAWCERAQRFVFDWVYHPNRELNPTHTLNALTRAQTRAHAHEHAQAGADQEPTLAESSENQQRLEAAPAPPSRQRKRPREINPLDLPYPGDDTPCEACGQNTHWTKMLLCDRCNTAWHFWCLVPEVKTRPPGNWYCPRCPKSTHNQSCLTPATVPTL